MYIKRLLILHLRNYIFFYLFTFFFGIVQIPEGVKGGNEQLNHQQNNNYKIATFVFKIELFSYVFKFFS